ncbi:Alpha/Beta hydrolase protein [Aspergillus unguis]
MTILEHPLGRIRGVVNNNVSEYLGLQYATLADQFAPPVLKDLHGDIDATSYGPTVTAPDECAAEFGLIQQDLPHSPFKQCITEGLSLNIVVPQTQDKKSLPVLVFLHGGGLATGSANWPQNHISNLISLSNELGMPVVGVSVNYRVGPTGFLTSQELRDAGVKPNNGLRDQRVALEWIQRNIHGFGGDSGNITLVGHSAGGASGTYHLSSEKPLFKRLACLSGQFLAVQPLPPAVHEHFYAETIRMLGLENAAPEERVSQLKKLSPEDLAKVSVFPSRPLVDGEVCTMAPSYKCIEDGIPEALHGGWCESILIGDCQFDGTILALALDHRKENIGNAFASFIEKGLADLPEVAAQLLSSYEIQDGQDDEALRNILRLANDLVFYAPSMCLAQAWKSSSAYVYQFNQANPWQGRWQGEACHITDLTALLQNYTGLLPEENKAVGREYAADILAFASGKAPWEAFKADNNPFIRNGFI